MKTILIPIVAVILISIVIIIYYFVTPSMLFFWLIYPQKDEIPENRFNFVGMTRMEVLDWVDKNGRATKYSYIRPGDKNWNKIEINAPDNYFYDSVQDVLKDEFVIKKNEWLVGGMSLPHGTYLYYRIVFKNDIVVEQYNSEMRDG